LSEPVVRARVGKRLARDAELSDVQVNVHVEEPPRLTVVRAGQVVAERRFEDFPARCNARRDAIAVAVALALERAPEPAVSAAGNGSNEAGATTQAGDAAEGQGRQQPNAARASDTAAAQQSNYRGPSPLPSLALELGGHAGAIAVLEVLPGVAFAGLLGADVQLPMGVRLSLSAIGSLPQEDEALGARVESRLLLGRLLGCVELGGSALAVEGCGGALAGAVFAEGLGYASTRSTELAYMGLVVRAALRYPAQGVLSVRLALDGLLPLVRPSYAVREPPNGGLATATPAPIGAALALEFVLALP
jgi:hypothetical protein